MELPNPIYETIEDKEHDTYIQLRQFFANLHYY